MNLKTEDALGQFLIPDYEIAVANLIGFIVDDKVMGTTVEPEIVLVVPVGLFLIFTFI